jgi:ribonuclease P protein component
VARNRVKRRLRELSRTRILPADVAADVIIRIRPEAYQAPFASLAADVDRVVVQLQRWRASDPEPVAASTDGNTGETSSDS